MKIKTLSRIFSFAGSIGFGLTIASAIKQTVKLTKDFDFYGCKKKDIIKASIPYYLETIGLAALSISFLNIAKMPYKKGCEELAAACAVLSNGAAVAKRESKENNEKILSCGVSIEKETMYDAFSNRFFEASEADIYLANAELNKILALFDRVSLNDYYDILSNPDLKTLKGGDSLGWDIMSSLVFHELPCIDITISSDYECVDGVECRVVSFLVPPSVNY